MTCVGGRRSLEPREHADREPAARLTELEDELATATGTWRRAIGARRPAEVPELGTMR